MATAATDVIREEYGGLRSPLLPGEVLRKFSVLNPGITLSHVVLEWMLILTSIWACSRFWHPALYLLAVVWIGSRQHALGVLMHEGAHYRIFRNRTWNEWVSDVFLAWPILITTASYRANHSQHHRHTNTEHDPDCHRKLFQMRREDWEFPTTRLKLFISFLLDITAVSSFYILRSLFLLGKTTSKEARPNGPSIASLARIAFYLAILTSSVVFGFWKELLLFWLVPFLTVFNFLLHVRSIAEHFATENDDPLNITRTTIIPAWEKIFFPKNINYHLEHHLYPAVPFYRLPALHRELMGQPTYRQKAHVTYSYFGVLRECVRLNGFKRTCLRTH
jgi:fatty acid desaturase